MVLATGANTGIGQVLVVALAQAGASIVGVGGSAMEETQANVFGAGARFHPSVSISRPLSRSCTRLRRRVGGSTFLVNNAGIIRRADAIDFTEPDWDDLMNVNLKTAVSLAS